MRFIDFVGVGLRKINRDVPNRALDSEYKQESVRFHYLYQVNIHPNPKRSKSQEVLSKQPALLSTVYGTNVTTAQ